MKLCTLSRFQCQIDSDAFRSDTSNLDADMIVTVLYIADQVTEVPDAKGTTIDSGVITLQVRSNL